MKPKAAKRILRAIEKLDRHIEKECRRDLSNLTTAEKHYLSLLVRRREELYDYLSPPF